MKKTFIFLLCIILFVCFPLTAFSSDDITEGVFDSIPRQSREILEKLGIDENITDTFSEISVSKAINVIIELFTDGFREILKNGVLSLALIFVSVFINGLLPQNGSIFLMGKAVSFMTVIYSMVSFTGEIFSECCSSLLVTKDFMLTLIPVFTGVVSFSGNPSLALSFNTVVFSFAELVAMIFQNIVPSLCAVLVSVCAAGAINPFVKLDGFSKTLNKAITMLMAFIAGIFVAVLSVRGVIAGAADSVTIRGVRFLIGNTVPVVGSAIGEALNSVVAGMGLIKNTVGMLGVAGTAVINIPVLIKLILWKAMLYVTGVTADITGSSEIKSFSDNLGGVLSVIMGAIFFVSFVFIISIAIIITVGRG